MKNKVCYFCEESASTKEHYPPKAFFPNNGRGLQLRTVPSCLVHNNDKSHLDQYVLAHITMNQGRDLNLARRRFDESIKPQLLLREKFKQQIANLSECLADGSVRYPVNISKFDDFFDALSRAVLFDKFCEVLPSSEFILGHVYLSFQNDPEDADRVKLARGLGYDFFTKNKSLIDEKIHDHLDEFVYRRKIIAPCGYSASISILHTFYGFFDVVTFVSNKQVMNAVEIGLISES